MSADCVSWANDPVNEQHKAKSTPKVEPRIVFIDCLLFF